MKGRLQICNIPLHFYIKTLKGGIFYKIEDMILYFTIYSCRLRELKDIKVIGFTLMFNHIHSLELSKYAKTLGTLHKLSERDFSREYNAEYGISGHLFDRPYGFAAKRIAKKVRECETYIANNPVAGKLCNEPCEYRWNLLAYYNNDNPYSKVINRHSISKAMRESINTVDIYSGRNKHLNYASQRRIFQGLNKEERLQITDYIISKYNFLDYDETIKLFGSYEKALTTFQANAGAEYELPDDNDDYSIYRKMSGIMKKLGYSVDCKTISTLSDRDIRRISQVFFERLNAANFQICKFLRLLSRS